MFCTNRGRNMSMDNKSPGIKDPPKILRLEECPYLLGIVALGVGIYFLTRKKPKPEGLIQVNGRIEGDVILISSKYNGKIKQLFAREGDMFSSIRSWSAWMIPKPALAWLKHSAI